MDEFTPANIAVSDEKREEELEKLKKGQVDYISLEKEIVDAKSHAKQVYLFNKMFQTFDFCS